MKRLILAACLAATTSLSAHAASDTVMIGEPSWPGAKIIANLIKVVIEEKLGGQAELVPGTNPVIFAAVPGTLVCQSHRLTILRFLTFTDD